MRALLLETLLKASGARVIKEEVISQSRIMAIRLQGENYDKSSTTGTNRTNPRAMAAKSMSVPKGQLRIIS